MVVLYKPILSELADLAHNLQVDFWYQFVHMYAHTFQRSYWTQNWYRCKPDFIHCKILVLVIWYHGVKVKVINYHIQNCIAKFFGTKSWVTVDFWMDAVSDKRMETFVDKISICSCCCSIVIISFWNRTVCKPLSNCSFYMPKTYWIFVEGQTRLAAFICAQSLSVRKKSGRSSFKCKALK